MNSPIFLTPYKAIGMAYLGVILSCGRDFELFSGFNPKMKLTRTKTIMEGYDCCDFRISLTGGTHTRSLLTFAAPYS